MTQKKAVAVFQSPPGLAGYTYSPEEARLVRDNGQLLAIRLETSLVCNFRCRYCDNSSGKPLQEELPFEVQKRVVREAKGLGAKSVVVIGGGEPTLYKYFEDLIGYINRQGLVPVVITNATKLSARMAGFLFDTNTSVLFKLDSLDERTQDYLAGKQGAYRTIKQGMKNLFEAGFNKVQGKHLRCGASFVLTKLNYKEIPAIWEFCRENNIFPNLEDYIPRNAAFENLEELQVDKKAVRRLKEDLLALDREKFGYDWIAYTPLIGAGCLQHMYGLYISSQGYLRPCADIDVREHNVKNIHLKDALKTQFFQYARNIEKHLQGQCFQCEHNAICVGCRGNAFCGGIAKGLDPYQALCLEDPLCWKK